jgi:hypothetical protein
LAADSFAYSLTDAIGLGLTVLIVGLAATGILGANGALSAAILHSVGTLVVIGNAGRLLKFDEVSIPASFTSRTSPP